MKTINILATTAAALSLLGSAALAQGAPGVKAACMPDLQRLCPGVAPGRGAFKQCFSAHRSEISPGCHSAMEAAKAARAERKAQAAAQGQSAPPPQGPPPGPGAPQPQ